MKILIDTDWFAAIQDLPPNKQKEVMNALLNYPNGNSDTNLWKKTILPNLEKGRIAYYNKIQNLKQNNPQKTNKKITDSDIGSVSVSASDTTIREDIYKENKENSKKGGVGEKEKGENNFTPPKDAEEVYEYAQINGIICPKTEAQNFYDYYSGIGWCLPNYSKTPMKDWHPFWQKWLRNPLQQSKTAPRMSIKEIKAAENHMKLEKMLKGEL